MSDYKFPFGQLLKPALPSADGPRRAFVLGAYPSALHVSWTAPNGEPAIAALPIDNEPEPFWTGADEDERIQAWTEAAQIDPSIDGIVKGVGLLNGSSGLALDHDYLKPLGISRSDAWITDALSTYRMSTGVADALNDRFVPTMKHHPSRLPDLPSHPNENAIVREATEPARLQELRSEFETAASEVLVTLGNAAARVLQAMVDTTAGTVPLKKSEYGAVVELPSGQRWYPLAHPGATRKGRGWHEVHADWTP